MYQTYTMNQTFSYPLILCFILNPRDCAVTPYELLDTEAPPLCCLKSRETGPKGLQTPSHPSVLWVLLAGAPCHCVYGRHKRILTKNAGHKGLNL